MLMSTNGMDYIGRVGRVTSCRWRNSISPRQQLAFLWGKYVSWTLSCTL